MLKKISCLFALVLWLTLGGLPVAASATEAAIVLSKHNEVQAAFLVALRSALPQSGAIRVREAGAVGEGYDEAILARADVIVAVGAEAANQMAERSGVPILAVLISTQNLRALQIRYPRAKIGGIVLDQPLLRHFRLVRSAMPSAERVGILLGPQSAPLRPALQDAAVRAGFKPNFEQIGDGDALLPALERLLEASDLILAVPDSLAYTPNTARPILLTTYRYRKPVFGYSQAYVTAGALAGVFSAPEDVARQTAEWLAQQAAGRIDLPPAEPPRYFSVGVNRHVARALSITLSDESALADGIERRK
jgi:putative tryptophan/tyrosine transport system substrate-binding protein